MAKKTAKKASGKKKTSSIKKALKKAVGAAKRKLRGLTPKSTAKKSSSKKSADKVAKKTARKSSSAKASAKKAVAKKASRKSPAKKAPAARPIQRNRKAFTIKAPSIPEEQRQIPMQSLDEGDHTASEILKRIRETLAPAKVQLANQSEQHAGHAEARRHGGGHYHLHVTSEAFDGLGLKERQLWVMNLLRDLFEAKQIHRPLSI